MERAISTRNIVATLALLPVLLTGCGGSSGSGENIGVPVITISANPTSAVPGDESTIEWTSTNATGCTASGGWSGDRPAFGSESTGALFSTTTYYLECTGAGGSSSSSATVGVTSQAPTLSFSASATSINAGEISTLTWLATNATSCTASGAWSGDRPLFGSESTGALTADSTYFLECSNPEGNIKQSVTINVAGNQSMGLDFPGSASVPTTMRFRFLNPLAIYPATYIWRAYPRQQYGFYTAFFWGNDDGAGFWWDRGNPNTFYGAHPYPVFPDKVTHHWEIATDAGGDYTSPELVQYDRWYTQALVAWADSAGKHTVFYWDLPDTSRVIQHTAPTSYGNLYPPTPALTWGDAPWAPGSEVWNGILRGIQIYSANLSVPDLLSEVDSPLSTSAGAANIWYLNLDPAPDDISDKSGRGHDPEWVGDLRPDVWTQ